MEGVKELNKLERRLAEAGARAASARAELDAATSDRDLLILEASRHGISRRRVAELAGVTAGRVQQILDASR